MRVSSDPKCRWGKDLVITKWTLEGTLGQSFGHDPADLEPNFIMACAENGKGYAYEVACKDTSEFFRRIVKRSRLLCHNIANLTYKETLKMIFAPILHNLTPDNAGYKEVMEYNKLIGSKPKADFSCG